MALKFRTAASALVFLAAMSGAWAGPWADPGDSVVRSDVELLAGAGLIDNLTMQWPIPWAGLLNSIDQDGSLDTQPAYIRDAALRLRRMGKAQTQTGRLRAEVTLDGTNSPATIRGFDALGREKGQAEASVDYVFSSTAIHLAVGAQTSNRYDQQTLMFDGSYIAQRLGNVVVYAGYMPHWWGPGWISGLQLSTNARPMPQIGFSRLSTAASDWWLLSWMGPWQFEFFAGVLDGPRVAHNTVYDGMRFAFSPIPHLEIALSRTDEMCGSGHSCNPIVDYFDFRNGNQHANNTNDQGSIELRYSNTFHALSYAVYTQAMNEDTNPIYVSGTSHLFGASFWFPMLDGVTRLTAEYTDSRSTKNIWGGGIEYGFSYNNGRYVNDAENFDGMRYRNRSLGFSLDCDSRLLSLQASYTDAQARALTLTYHHAIISDPANYRGNAVSSAPVTINAVQARLSIPFTVRDRAMRLQIEGRLQDDQPRPDSGNLATIEAALTFGL